LAKKMTNDLFRNLTVDFCCNQQVRQLKISH
jgi:hypothetical protein